DDRGRAAGSGLRGHSSDHRPASHGHAPVGAGHARRAARFGSAARAERARPIGGVRRASDLPRARNGRRIRVAGSVITRQRPGTAKGFVFLTLEDETGIANIIVRPDLFDRNRLTILEQPFLLVDGILQNQEGVTSVKAERLHSLANAAIAIDSHDFY